jgi:hypothetical protein
MVRIYIRLAALVALFVAISSGTLAAQQTRALQDGVRIRIEMKQGRARSGNFAEMSGDSLTYRNAGRGRSLESVSLSDVKEVKAWKGRSAGKGFLKYGLIGLGAGVLTGILTTTNPCSGRSVSTNCDRDGFCNTTSECRQFNAIILSVPGFLIGGIVGAFVGGNHWERVPVIFR